MKMSSVDHKNMSPAEHKRYMEMEAKMGGNPSEKPMKKSSKKMTASERRRLKKKALMALAAKRKKRKGKKPMPFVKGGGFGSQDSSY